MKATKKVASKKAKKPLACGCLEAAQKAAAEKSFRFKTCIAIDFDRGTGTVDGPFLAIENMDGKPKRKLPLVTCAYCPFCGKKKP